MKVSKQWFAEESDAGWFAIYHSNKELDNNQLTEGGCGCCSGFKDCVEHEHVARLMASAPEMLALLRKLDKYGPDSVDTTELLNRLDDIEFTEA